MTSLIQFRVIYAQEVEKEHQSPIEIYRKENKITSRISGWIEMSCPMKTDPFPFDVQNCEVMFYNNPMHSANHLVYQVKVDYRHVINYDQEFQFEIFPYPKRLLYNSSARISI